MAIKPQFNFTKEQLEDIRAALKAHFLDELDTDLSNLQCDLFVDFLNENIGKYYYNLGVTDTIAAVKEKAEDLVLLIKD